MLGISYIIKHLFFYYVLIMQGNKSNISVFIDPLVRPIIVSV